MGKSIDEVKAYVKNLVTEAKSLDDVTTGLEKVYSMFQENLDEHEALREQHKTALQDVEFSRMKIEAIQKMNKLSNLNGEGIENEEDEEDVGDELTGESEIDAIIAEATKED